MEEFLEKYINDLYEKQNKGAAIEQQGLYTKKDYYELLKPVVQAVITHKDYSLDELRTLLYNESGIEDKVREFVLKREMTPGMVFSYGTSNYKETVVIGNKQEVSIDENGKLFPSIEKMTEDTIFDLASITKLFTSLSVLQLVKDGVIDLNDKVTKYAPEFVNLGETTIYDLMSFGVALKTNGRVDGVSNKEEAEKILFTLYPDKENANLSPYTDMGAMALKYVIEHATSENYYDYVNKNILVPLKMHDTYASVPKYKLDRVASTNMETKVLKEWKVLDITDKTPGVVNDGKAAILGQSEGVLSGHAGMFSTAGDMTNLAKGIIGGQVIDKEYVEMMAKNRTGRKYIDNDKEKYVQYLGFLCYSKHPRLSDSEVFHALSGRTFANGGYTGNQMTVDPINELYFFLGSNRTHNRVSIVDPSLRDQVKLDENNKGTIVLPDGRIKTTSYKYAWDRDEYVVHPSIKLAIQYKMLEDIYKLTNEQIDEQVKVKQL